MSIAAIERLIVGLYAVAIPTFLVCIALEVRLHRQKPIGRGYHRADARTSLSLGILMVVGSTLLRTTIVAFHTWCYQFRLLELPVGAAWVWPLAIIADDFAFYWYHRVHHRVRLFWAIHGNHHSSEYYNFATALRQPVLAWITAPLFFAPLALLGIHPLVMMTAQAISLFYQFFLHTERIGRLGPLEWVLNTPSHHRVHHGKNLPYLDKNYGGILIVWDRLFGTFEAEGEPVRFGLTHVVPVDKGVLHAFSHELVDLARDVVTARSLRRALGFVFGPPGWGKGETTEDLQRRQQRQQKARTDATIPE
jgi:sterol desaturase/sphingolipid hydroxylase (fatty acid hydroxylase superfamily)